MKARLVITLALSSLSIVALAAGTAPPAGLQAPQALIDAAFAKADPDHDGTVTRAEATRFGITRPAFQHANPDKDATLDKAEFLEAIKFQFGKANVDSDGTLDAKEAAKAGVRSKRAFAAADGDKDGTLDLAEYLQALTAKAH